MTILLLIGLGAWVALDGVAVGQFMVSRPLVAGLLAGWVLGDPAAGVAVGALLELYLLVAVPAGGARFPEPGPATVVGATAAVWIGGPAGLALGVAGGLVWGQVGASSQTVLRHATARLVPVAGEGVVTAGAVRRAHWSAIALDAVRGAALTGAGLAAAAWLSPHLAPSWPLDGPGTRALLLVGGMVSLGALARGEAPGAGRAVLLLGGLALGLLVGVVVP